MCLISLIKNIYLSLDRENIKPMVHGDSVFHLYDHQTTYELCLKSNMTRCAVWATSKK